MPESATNRGERRAATAHRITVCAQRLTDARGLDGFTMDELAEQAGVSRRTLFNYFPGKVDAVLGAVPEIPATDLARFREGGPHGRLTDDLAVLAVALLAEGEFDRESVELGRRVLLDQPRLLVAAHQRFEQLTGEFVTLILQREGNGFGQPRARLLVRILVTVFDAALDLFLTDPLERPLAERFDEAFRTARDLLA